MFFVFYFPLLSKRFIVGDFLDMQSSELWKEARALMRKKFFNFILLFVVLFFFLRVFAAVIFFGYSYIIMYLENV